MEKTCSYEGCGRGARRGGLCDGHYQQRRKGHELRPLRPQDRPKECVVEGCASKVVAHGLCDRHDRQRRRGADLVPGGIRVCAASGCTKRVYRVNSTLCGRHTTKMRLTGTLDRLKVTRRGACGFDGCDERGNRNGLCPGHHAQKNRGQALRPIRPRFSEIRIEGDVAYVSVRNRQDEEVAVARVDAHQADLLRGSRWCMSGTGYAVRGGAGSAHRQMHRLLLNAPEGVEVDHRNGDRLDNRLANLRLATRAENAQNIVGARARRDPKDRNVHVTRSGTFAVIVRGRRVGTFATREGARAEAARARAGVFPFANEDRHR